MSLLLATAIALTAAAPASSSSSPVLISGVHFDGVLLGTPEPDSAVRLINTDAKRAVDVGGFVLTERFSPEKKKKETTFADEKMSTDVGGVEDGDSAEERDMVDRKGGGARDLRNVRLPDGARIPPGGEIWIAASASGFRQVFGMNPDYEASDTDVSVPNASASRGFLLLPAEHGTVALIDSRGEVADFVAYAVDDAFSEGSFAGVPWKGGPIRLAKTSFFGWKGQVLARDRDERGRVLPDTDSGADWDSGFSRKTLGEEPTHRVEIAGQSRFLSQRMRVKAKVLATSAPDNNYAALIDAIRSARRELRVRIYEMTNPKIVEELIKAKLRGVRVMIFLEGAPVGGIADQERWLVDRAARAGCAVHFMATPKGSRLKPRYRFDHSKYVLVDDRLAIIGSENYGRTGVPVHNSYGNRGWMVHVENPAFVKQLRAVWDHDYRPGVMQDVIAIDASPTDAYGLPYRDPSFTPDEEFKRGLYEKPAAPLLVEGVMDLELVLSPDTSLNENSALIGMIKRAKQSVLIEQNSIRRRWGRKDDSSAPEDDDKDDAENTPNLALQAVVAAARRGVQVRVLLDSTWYNVQGDEDRDNDDTVAWLNDIARKEKLDMSAKVINLETAHLEKIHTKGIIVDDAEVFVGSINWTENSFKGNREVGVVVGDPRIAGYYAKLFRRDWAQSRIYSADVIAKGEVRSTRDASGKLLRRVGRGERLWVVAEHGMNEGGRPQWVEVAHGDVTGFIDPNVLGAPEASAREALHVIGRDAVVIGRVAATNVSERRIQLRIGDDKRPPFTAVIFKGDERRFVDRGVTPASAYQGREVRIRGKVTTYKGPEILVNSPDQIEIVR